MAEKKSGQSGQSKGGQQSGGNFKNDPKRASAAGKKGGEHSHGGTHETFLCQPLVTSAFAAVCLSGSYVEPSRQARQRIRSQARARMRTAWAWLQPRSRALR